MSLWSPRPPPGEQLQAQSRSSRAPPSPTRASQLRAEFARNRHWPGYEKPMPVPPTSLLHDKKEADEYWSRLASPRAGYSRDEQAGPAKKTDKAVWNRKQFLRMHGYGVLSMREQQQLQIQQQHEQQSAASGRPGKDADLDDWTKQQAILMNCWRTGRKPPERVLRKLPPPQVDSQ